MFNTVEGNSTFYSLPSLAVAQRWADQTAPGFHFAFKVPREISHESTLGPSTALDRFLEVLRVFAANDRLGPSFLQLPRWFDCSRLTELRRFLESLPASLPWAVEVRHPSWFDEDRAEHALQAMLVELQIDRVIFDSRALFQRPPDDESEREAQQRKPKSPVRYVRTGNKPLVRLVGRNQVALNDQFIESWLPTLQQWVTAGCRPYVFTHAPDDHFAPAFARRLAEAYQKVSAQAHALPKLIAPPRQLSLFDD